MSFACFLLYFLFSPEVGECTYLINGSDPWGEEEQEAPASPSHIDQDLEYSLPTVPIPPSVDPCIITGRLNVTENWYGYLGVFDLREQGSRMFYRVVYPERRCCPVSLLLYISEQVKSLNYRMSCDQKVSVINALSPQVIRLSPLHSQSGCVNQAMQSADKTKGPLMTVECQGGRVLKSNVVRKWFIAASSCGSPRGFSLTYTIIVYGHIGQCPSIPLSSHNTVHSPSFVIIWVSFTYYITLTIMFT